MFHRYRKTVQLLVAAAALGLFLLVMTACNSVALTSSSALLLSNSLSASHSSMTYQFKTHNNNTDPTFNQLLGINNHGVIAGYFGSGTVVNGKLHPNKGYTLSQPYAQGNYTNENFPGSVQPRSRRSTTPVIPLASGSMAPATTSGFSSGMGASRPTKTHTPEPPMACRSISYSASTIKGSPLASILTARATTMPTR